MSITITGADLLRAFQSMQITREELPHHYGDMISNLTLIGGLFQKAFEKAEQEKQRIMEINEESLKSVTTKP